MTNRILFFLLLIFIFSCSPSLKLKKTESIKTVTVEHYTYKKKPVKLFKLPGKVEETSGLIKDGNTFWTHNDSGGDPIIYKIEGESGNIVAKVFIENAENRDWEDITQDEQYIYVGDHGNNAGMRKDQKLYKIDKNDIQARSTDTVQAEIISFSFAEQESWAFQLHAHNFDCESVVNIGDQLLLFTKDWDDENTRIYSLSKVPGEYSLKASAEIPINGLVTGADYNAETDQMALIGYHKNKPFIALIEDFNSSEEMDVKRFALPKIKFAQTEGIVYKDSKTLIFSAEKTKAFKQALYSISIDDLINTSANIKESQK